MAMAMGLINEEWVKETLPKIGEILRGSFTNAGDEVVVNHLVDVADGLVDTIYVCASFLNMFGFPGDQVWNIVQERNIAKATDCDHRVMPKDSTLYVKYEQDECPKCEGTGKVIVRRADGKILKPEGWYPPEQGIKAVLMAELVRVQNAGLPRIPD